MSANGTAQGQQAYDSKAGRSVVLALGVGRSVPVWARRFDAAGWAKDRRRRNIAICRRRVAGIGRAVFDVL